jgi:hypothetical protein
MTLQNYNCISHTLLFLTLYYCTELLLELMQFITQIFLIITLLSHPEKLQLLPVQLRLLSGFLFVYNAACERRSFRFTKVISKLWSHTFYFISE